MNLTNTFCRKVVGVALVVVGVIYCALGANMNLLDDWRFRRGDVPGAEAVGFDDSSWEQVRIPHDWAISGPFDISNDLQVTAIVWDGEKVVRTHTGRTGGLPWPGKGWYRRSIDIPAGTQYAELVFEAAMSHATVFADGCKVGEWKHGYNSFVVPIPTTTRTIAVSLDNPPESSRWYPGSGLIRPVRLVTGGKTGIATWGNYIRTTALAADKATVAVTTRVRGDAEGCILEWTLRAPDGKVAATAVATALGEETSCELVVSSPQLWSPETPSLYRLETSLKKRAAVVDRRTDRVGIRMAGFTRDGFFLNGVKRPFRGVCLHHDLGPLGAAFNKSAFRRQVRILKEIGVDSIRTSHNMPSPDQLDVCDEEGIMVMAESFDMWMSARTPNDYSRHFKDWWRRDLENLVVHHRSHPSVVMWSIGNEVQDKDTAAVRDIAEQMVDLCHRLDPTRPVVLVTDRPDALSKSGAIQVTDVPALTYRLHRYEFMHEHSPIGLVLGGETASTFSSRGCYHFPDEAATNIEHEDGQSSSYDVEHGSWSNLPDDDWAMQDDHPWAIGEFVWTGFDYLGEPTPYKTYWPSRSSYFGIFDLAGLPKDRAWLYRSRWRKDSSTLHVLPHWTWPGREGRVTPVYVYTSYPEAELFVNGVSQGRRRRNPASRLDRYRLRWRDVVYAPGELRVVAYDETGRAAAEETVRTAGAPHHLEVQADRTRLSAPSAQEMPDLAFVTVRVCDKDGNYCPTAAVRIRCEASGAVAFKAMCNGDATSLEPFVRPEMLTFRGALVAVAEAKSAGRGRFAVSADGMTSVEIDMTVGDVGFGCAARGVLERFAGKAAAAMFAFEKIDASEPQAEVLAKDGNILVRATDENRATAAVGRYIREVAKGHWSRCGNRVPSEWPLPKEPLNVKAVLPHLHAYNYCVFSYSFAFYGKDEWRANIDRLALFGFTSALVPTGNMKVWQLFLRDAGFSEEQIAEFIPDETAQSWVNCGVMEGVGAPLPLERIDEEARLGRWIVNEMRALGIEPMLQGLTGLLPNSATNVICGAKWPDAKMYDQGRWAGGLKRPVLLDATTDAYAALAKMWYRRLYEVYGVSDPKFFVGNLFSEGGIAEDVDCPKIAAAMQRGQQIASPGATWCISCWGRAPRQDLLDGLNPDLARIIVLDKNMANGGVFPRGFGKITWIWGELLNFGGNEGMYGGMDALLNLGGHMKGPNGATLRGYALESEGLDSNPVFYDLFTDLFFRPDAVSGGAGAIDRWLADYAERRYGLRDGRIEKALSLLARSVWNVNRLQEGCSESVFCARPKWNVVKSSSWASKEPLYYDPKVVEEAAGLYLAVAREKPDLLGLATFRFDFTDVFRQVLSDRGIALVPRLKDDVAARDEFLLLIRRMDELLACTEAFRLDTYEARARKRAGERGVRALRRMFTTWIERPDTNLNDYAHHQFAGLLSGYYAKRWEAFFADPDNADAALDALEREAPSAGWPVPPRDGDLLAIAAAMLGE